jgi:hypothetical protein
MRIQFNDFSKNKSTKKKKRKTHTPPKNNNNGVALIDYEYNI